MYDKKSGLTFLQRNNLVPTYRNPMPAASPSELLVHSIPLDPPLPLPAIRASEELSDASPDRYKHSTWVHEE